MLMFTDNQLQILAVLVSQPEKDYYMSELGEVLGKHPGVFQRGLNSLEQQGYVASRRRGNQRLFRINTNHPLFAEIKKIVEKTSGVEGLLRTLVNNISEITVAIIYGSYAKNRMRTDSDIDLLIVSDVGDSEQILLKRLPALERKLQREINYKFYLTKEFKKSIGSHNPFLEEVLKDKYILLKGTI